MKSNDFVILFPTTICPHIWQILVMLLTGGDLTSITHNVEILDKQYGQMW